MYDHEPPLNLAPDDWARTPPAVQTLLLSLAAARPGLLDDGHAYADLRSITADGRLEPSRRERTDAYQRHVLERDGVVVHAPATHGTPEHLLYVVQQLALSHTLDEIIAVIRQETRTLVGADGVTFVVREGARCRYVDEDAVGPLWKGQSFPLEACVSGWAMQQNEPAVIPDIYMDLRVPHEAYRPTFVKSMAMFPIRTHEPIAAIGTYWATTHCCTEAEVATLQALADSTAIAITNVQLVAALAAAKAQAEHEVAMRDQFLSLVAHELKTPLTTMYGSTQLLQRRLEQLTGFQEREKRVVHTLHDQTVRLQRLINSLLDLSRLEHGRLVLELAPCDLGALIQKLLDELQPTLMIHAFEVVGCDTPCMVLGDCLRLEQVFQNVLHNAIKYSPEGGRIRIQIQRAQDHVRIDVLDEGMGIPDLSLPHIFERFYRASNVNTSQLSGMGIGLYVAQEIMALHGGTIAIQNRSTQGCAVSLTLPVYSES